MAFGLTWCSLLTAATVTISASKVPPGALAQIRLQLDRPLPVASGKFTISLSPNVFGPITDVHVFSAAGDALGTASIDGARAVVSFSSLSGGVGRLNGMPVATITAPVLATASGSSAVTVTLEAWKDAAGTAFAVTSNGGTMTVGSGLVIEHIVPTGTNSYRISGKGFLPTTRFTASGVQLNVTTGSTNEIDFVTQGPVEFTGQTFRAQNLGGETTEFVYALETVKEATDDGRLRVFVPLRTQESADLGRLLPLEGIDDVVLENPYPVPVELTVEMFEYAFAGKRQKFTLPARGRMMRSLDALGFPRQATGGLLASMPVRVALVHLAPNASEIVTKEAGRYEAFHLEEPPFQVNANLRFGYRQGNMVLPDSQSFAISVPRIIDPIPLTVTSNTPWLTVSPLTELRHVESVTVSVSPGLLAPGEYSGTITVTARVPGAKPQSIPVSLTVWAPRFVVVSPVELMGSVVAPVITSTVGIFSNIMVPISIRVEMDGTGRWLSATNMNVTAATAIEVKADPAGLAPGKYQGRVILTGPENTATLPVTLTVFALEPPRPFFQPSELNLSLPAGEGAVLNGIVASTSAVTFFDRRGVTLSSTANWLRLDSASAEQSGRFTARVDARTLPPGLYTGFIKGVGQYASGELPVRLRLWSPDTPTSVVRVTPTTLQLTGQSATLTVISEGVPEVVQADVETPADGCRMSAAVAIRNYSIPQATTPADVTVDCFGPPGRYSGAVRVTAGNRVVIVPVSVVIPPVLYTGPVAPPAISAVTNSASNAMGPVAAGEMVTLHGIGQGRKVAFDGQPATILYESLYQTNVLVPAAVAGKDRVTMQVTAGGTAIATVPVVAAAPAIFTIDGTGRGGGAILNQDNVINSAEHPAAAGEVIQIFATGAVTPLKLTIGGKDAEVLFSGVVSPGLFQVNAVVPDGVSGTAAIVLQASGIASPGGVTLAVR